MKLSPWDHHGTKPGGVKIITGSYPFNTDCYNGALPSPGDAISKQRNVSKFSEFHHLPEVPANICE